MPSPSTSLRPTAPLHRTSSAYSSPAAASASSATHDRRRVAERLDLGVERRRLDVGRRRHLTDGLHQSRQQRAELELVEQHAHGFGVERALTEIVGGDADVAVAPQDRHLPVQQHPVAHRAEVLALLRRELVEVLEDPFERAVRVDELGRGLLADAGDAGQVVAGVAAQRGVLGVLLRA